MASGLAASTCVVPAALALDDEPTIVRVEEDWGLLLIDPDGAIESPQFHTVISPFADAESIRAQVVWNYRESPEFQAGGLQLQGWNGEEMGECRSVGNEMLSSEPELVTWTTTMETNGQKLIVGIEHGRSSSWGQFGGGSMQIQYRVEVPDLNAYDPSVSARESMITFGANRVVMLAMVQSRRIDSHGGVSVDYTPRVVYHMQEMFEE